MYLTRKIKAIPKRYGVRQDQKRPHNPNDARMMAEQGILHQVSTIPHVVGYKDRNQVDKFIGNKDNDIIDEFVKKFSFT